MYCIAGGESYTQQLTGASYLQSVTCISKPLSPNCPRLRQETGSAGLCGSLEISILQVGRTWMWTRHHHFPRRGIPPMFNGCPQVRSPWYHGDLSTVFDNPRWLYLSLWSPFELSHLCHVFTFQSGLLCFVLFLCVHMCLVCGSQKPCQRSSSISLHPFFVVGDHWFSSPDWTSGTICLCLHIPGMYKQVVPHLACLVLTWELGICT